MSEKKPLRVAIIGISPGMGKLHLEAVLEHGAEVRAVCDTNPETLKTVSDELGIPEERRFADYHAFLNDPELDAVIVATPDQVHREISTAFLDARQARNVRKAACLEPRGHGSHRCLRAQASAAEIHGRTNLPLYTGVCQGKRNH